MFIMKLQHNLKINPYPYQEEGIKKGLEWKRLLIADQPGLGKTIQSIGIIDTADAYPALVICPSSLKINWQREVEKFTDKKALVLDNYNRTTWPYLLQMKMFHVAIVNYESLRKYFVWDIKGGKSFRLKDVVFCPQITMFKSVIIDESQRCKDPSTNQSIFTKGICIGKEYIILLSGTPVVNRPIDLVAQLSIMDRLKDFGGKNSFLLNYAQGEREASNLEELSEELYSRCMIRREKAKVLTQLPGKTRVDLYVEISNREEYDTAAQDLAKYLREYQQCTEYEVKRKMRMEALVKFMTLRSIASKGKVPQAIDFIKVFLESGNKLILFCSFHEIVDQLKQAFPKAVTVTGRDSSVMKQAAVDAFQQREDVQLIICSIKAAGVGLTLTASSNVAFVELPWTFCDCEQAEDRCIVEGEKILTPNGWKAIETIKIGNTVINKDGENAIVKDAWSKGNTKLVTEVKVEGYGVTKTTNDHLYLTTDGWKEAANLLPGDRIVMPKQHSALEECKRIKFDDDCRFPQEFISHHGGKIRNGRLIKAPEYISLTDDALFVFGYYAGDGFAIDRSESKKGRFVSFSGNTTTKQAALARCKQWIESIGVNFGEYKSKNSLAVEVRAYSAEWSLFFCKHFNNRSATKQLPEFLMQLNERQSRVLMSGLMASDGYYRKCRYEYVTASEKLASQVARLILKCGYRPTIGKNCTGHFVIAYSESQTENSALVQSVYTYFPKKNNGIRPKVYDITTDSTESFVLGMSVVHNCHRIGQKDNVTCYYLLGRGTIDHKLYSIIHNKKAIANSIMASDDDIPTDRLYFEELASTLLNE